jgi:hypothetical protein
MLKFSFIHIRFMGFKISLTGEVNVDPAVAETIPAPPN